MKMNQDNSIGDDYAISRVPRLARSSFFNVTLVRVGAITALSQFMLGAMLGHAMTFGQVLLAILLGSVILAFVSVGLGIAGAREGLSTSLLARWCGFGRFGSVLIGLAIAISSLGWFGVQNAVLANGINYATGGRLGGWSAVLSGTVLTALVVFGFRALSWTAKLAVPLFFLVIGWISVTLLQGHNIIDLITSTPTGTPLTLSAAATAVAGGYIAAAIITPDVSRYCQNGWHVFWMIITTILIGEFIVCGLAALIAHALNTADVVAIMTQIAGGIGLLTVILAAVKVNDMILYSASLALANAVEGITGKQWRRTWLTVASGVLGTALSMMGILDNFTDFLMLLGVVFPPIAGVMLVDYYVLRTSRPLLDASRAEQVLPDAAATPPIGWPAIAAWVAGSLVGLTVSWGIPSLNSLLVASVFYWGVCVFFPKK